MWHVTYLTYTQSHTLWSTLALNHLQISLGDGRNIGEGGNLCEGDRPNSPGLEGGIPNSPPRRGVDQILLPKGRFIPLIDYIITNLAHEVITITTLNDYCLLLIG